MIDKGNVQKIEKTIGYVFKDKSLLIQAFTRTSFVNEAKQSHKGTYQSNEVLEFLGDSVLSTAIITKLLGDKAKRYEHGLFTALDEGDFSNIKSRLSDKGNLSRSMDALGLAKYLVMGEGDRVMGIDKQPSVKEDLFESIIGAIYLDSEGSLGAVTKSLTKMLDVSVYAKGNAANHSAKGLLQEWCQSKKRRLPMPRYVTEDESGPAHQKMFMRACYVGDRLCGRGVGKNQAEADAAAAEAALTMLSNEEALSGTPTHKIDADAQTKLRNHAAKNKLPYPEFHDLGESPRSTESSHIYVIECRYLSKTATCEGASKSDARMSCAMKMLDIIGEEPRLESGDGKKSRKNDEKKPAHSVNRNGSVAEKKQPTKTKVKEKEKQKRSKSAQKVN